MNSLSAMDVSHLPLLRNLKLDSNRISRIDGLKNRTDLEHISWRGQRLEESDESSWIQYQHCIEPRGLYLSGNQLQSFAPSNSFLSLQRLELASSGIEKLGERFGICMPNLRYLNLNHNALKDLRPLLGIRGLIELHIAGNRVSRLRRTMTVLDRMGSSIKVLDCRANPITIGFYAPTDTENNETQLVVQKDHAIWEDESQSYPGDNNMAAAYLVPPADESLDQEYLKRLDRETVLRRRVYQLIVLSSSPQLERLDGLKISEEAITEKDSTWDKLVEMGVVQVKKDGDCNGNQGTSIFS